MTKYRNALLAGVAALALAAGTGFASAQTMDQKGGVQTGQSVSPGETHGSMKEKGSSRIQAQDKTKSGETAQSQDKTKAGETAQTRDQSGKGGSLQTQNQTNLGVNGKNGVKTGSGNTERNAQTNVRGKGSVAQGMDHHNSRDRNHRNARNSDRNDRTNNRNAQNLNRNDQTNKRGMAANNQSEQGRQTTAQQRNSSGQMQGNKGSERVQTSSGGSVRLSSEQRTQIQRTVINARNAPRVSSVQFNVNVGTVIPRHEFTSIRVVPVPEYLVRIEPRWRGLEYFVFRDEVVIVNPRDLRIVAIVPV